MASSFAVSACLLLLVLLQICFASFAQGTTISPPAGLRVLSRLSPNGTTVELEWQPSRCPSETQGQVTVTISSKKYQYWLHVLDIESGETLLDGKMEGAPLVLCTTDPMRSTALQANRNARTRATLGMLQKYRSYRVSVSTVDPDAEETRSSERTVVVTPVDAARGSGQRQLYNSGLVNRYTKHNVTVLDSDDQSVQTPTKDAMSKAAIAHDLDGDGLLDLVIANYGRNNDLLLGSGSASFTNVSTTQLPASTLESTGVAVIDALSPTDLIITNRDGPNVLLTNDGSGTYTAVSDSIISDKDENSSGVILFDFNGDGRQDVFICNYNERNELFQSNQEAGGDIEFVRKTNNMAVNGLEPCLGALALDKDGDGDLDLLIVNEDGAMLLENDGQGNFFKNTTVDYYEGSFWSSTGNNAPTGACAGDLQSSGKDNILLLFENSPNLLLFPDDEGRYLASPMSDNPTKSTACSFLDLENDGDLDILITNYEQPNSVFVNSGMNFVEVAEGPLIADSSSSVGFLFFDSDDTGDRELLVLNDNGYNEIFLHSGVDPLKAFSVSADPDAMKVTNMYSLDSNGNSFDDLYVLKKNEKNELYFNDGDGFLVKSEGGGDATASAANSKFALISDFNGDNALDILVCNDNAQNELLINNGGSFSKLESDVSEQALSTVGAVELDLNFDGTEDLFVLNYEGKSEILVGNGTGLFSRMPLNETPGDGDDIRDTDVLQAQKVITFDANNDGLKDLFIITYWDDVPSPNLFYVNTGTGFALQSDSATASITHKSSDVVAFDADGDGYDDLLVMNDGQANEFYLNDRKGGFELVDLGFLSLDTVYKNVKIVDVNGDGLPDVFLWSFGLQQVLLINEGDSFRQQQVMALNDQRTQTTGLATGDFDGDGDPDFFLSIMGSPNELLLNCGQMYTSNRELYCLPAISRPKVTSIQPSSILSQGTPVLFQGILGDSDEFAITLAGGEMCKKSEQITSSRWMCDIPARTSVEDINPVIVSYGRPSLPASLPYAAPLISSFEPAFNWNNLTTFTVTGKSLGSFQKVVRLVNADGDTYDCTSVKAIPGTSIHDGFTCKVDDSNFLTNQDVYHVNVSHDATESSKYTVSEGALSTCRVETQGSQACICNLGEHYENGLCTKCPPDTYSEGTGCSPCPAGAYSVAGSTSLDDCVCPENSDIWWIYQSYRCMCLPGYGGDATVKTKGCKACQIAGYKTNTFNEPCQLCPKGAFIPFHIAAADSEDDCTCSEGSEFNADRSECVCSLGHYGSGEESACHACPFGTYKDFVGNAAECSGCSGVLGEGATTENIKSVSSDACRCKYGRVRVGNECVLCPKGADCSNTQLQSVEALPGFWRNVANSTSWLECEQPIGLNLCEGKGTGINASSTSDGNGNALSSSVCRVGHTGNLCSSCKDGYGKHLGICGECSTIYLPILTAVLAFVFLLVVLYLLTAEALRRIHFIIFPSSGFEVEYLTQSFLKIFVNWLQLSSLALYLKIPKSTAMEYMLELQGASFLSPWNFQTFNCLFDYDFYTRYYYTMLVPVAAIVVAVVISALVQHSGLVGRPVLRDMITMNVQILLLLTYAGVTHQIFQIFECRNIGMGENVLYADPDVSCDTDEYKNAKLYGILFVSFFSVCLPVYLTLRLWWLKSKLYERKTFIGYSFLFYNYKLSTSIWYEGYCYARKLCAILVVTLIQDDTRRQIFLMGMLSVIFLGIHSYVKPYQNDVLNALESQALLTLAFSYNVCVLFQEGSSENRKDFELIWIWLSIILNIAMSLLCLFKIFKSYSDMGKLHKPAKKPAGLEDSLPDSMHMTDHANPKYNDRINGSKGFQDSYFPKDMTTYEDADAHSSGSEGGDGNQNQNNDTVAHYATRPHSNTQAISNPLCEDI